MTKKEAAIVAAYTGVLIGDFGDMHGYVEEIMERSVFTHEMGDGEIVSQIKGLAKTDFLAIEIKEQPASKLLLAACRQALIMCEHVGGMVDTCTRLEQAITAAEPN